MKYVWGSVFSAFILGCTNSTAIGMVASKGQMDKLTWMLIVFAGLAAAAKEYPNRQQQLYEPLQNHHPD